MRPRENISQLRDPILRSVSRSFFLSIRLLPSPLRDPVALAYLLARASDTIADTSKADSATRRDGLTDFAAIIDGKFDGNAVRDLAGQFAPRQQIESERKLIESLPDCLQWLAEMPAEDQQDIREVLGHISAGQKLDVERFPTDGLHALATAAELDEYTYLVAGSVGEFWTGLGFRKLARFAPRPAVEMDELGRAYGKGLQLINVLRDVGTDLRAGRCYLPAEELAAVGITPAEIFSRSEQAQPIIERWLTRAEEGISSGIEYAGALRPFRVRFATALPALIGARTIALLRSAGAESLQRPVKVRRGEVRRLVGVTAVNLASPDFLRKTFRRLLRSEA